MHQLKASIASILLFSALHSAQAETHVIPISNAPAYACVVDDASGQVLPSLRKGSRFVPLDDQRRSARIARVLRKLERAVDTQSKLAASRVIALRSERRLLRRLPRICRALVGTSCMNGALDSFEEGLDCGIACDAQCSDSGDPGDDVAPTPTPTPSPTADFTPAPYTARNQIECFDGIDNDGDGEIDFGDFGCNGVNGQETSADYGYRLHSPSSDSRIVYVSSSEGDDSHDGLSPLTPKRTVVAAYDLIRDGHPDWLLLRRGDVFDYADWRMRFGRSPIADPEYDFSWTKSGRSVSEPLVVGSYGSSPARPLIKTTNRHGFRIWTEHAVSLIGLNFYANYCDPNSADFRQVSCPNSIVVQYANTDILIEDNEVSYGGGGILIESIDAGLFDRVQVRRNVVHHNYSGKGHSQGMYTRGPGELLIEENVFFHSGWNNDYRMNLRPAAFDRTAWRAVSNGRIDIQLDRTWYTLSGLDFSAVDSYADVAVVLEEALQGAAGAEAGIAISHVGNELIFRSDLPSAEEYSVRRTTGGGAGTDIDGATLLDVRSGNPRTPAATIYNRHLYISGNYSNTTVRGNVTAMGASGAIQARMGGLIHNNLVMDEPVGIGCGHAENPVGVPFTATITDNVVLGASDIGNAPRGFGLGWSAGNNSYVAGNIIAHNRRGTGNVEGLFAGTDSANDLIFPHTDSVVTENIVYNWGGAALASRLENFSNVSILGNYFVQPVNGVAVAFAKSNALLPGRLSFGGNTYFTPPTVSQPVSVNYSSMAYEQWEVASGDTVSREEPNFRDPQRDISSYLTVIGAPSGDVEEFMALALQQSKLNWRPAFEANQVNEYMRQGFEILP